MESFQPADKKNTLYLKGFIKYLNNHYTLCLKCENEWYIYNNNLKLHKLQKYEKGFPQLIEEYGKQITHILYSI